MALTCGFFNSVDGDRKYDATQFASLFDGVITDGVVAAVGDFFATTPGGGMVVNVGSGRAWFNRTWTYSDAKIPLTLDASDLLYDRIDAIVLEIDTSVAVRDNSIKVIKGTPAQEPEKPALTNTGDIHQYALAYVRVKASSIEVGAGDITINVGQADCPFVTSIVETPELDVLFAQWDAQFTSWFENVQSQLEGDVAANLQRQIDLKANKVDIGDVETPAKKLGLTDDLSVGASLGVLATVGDLNVWRRTKNIGEEVPAGYKLVDDNTDRTVNGKNGVLINLGNTNQSTAYIDIASSISVNDYGIVSLNASTRYYKANDTSTVVSILKGKYVNLHYINDFGNWFGPPNLDQSKTYYVPNDSQVSSDSSYIQVSKLQRVESYPVTPPGTYIDYPVSVNPDAYQTSSSDNLIVESLGKLGEKNRVFVGSYVGTGTYGPSSPTSITCPFPPEFIWIIGYTGVSLDMYGNDFYNILTPSSLLSLKTTYTKGIGFSKNTGNWSAGELVGRTYCKKSLDGTQITWYLDTSGMNVGGDGPSAAQFNALSLIYNFICFGF